MPDPYLVALVLASGLFLYVVYNRLVNGRPITKSLLYVPLLLGIAFVFYKIWADGQRIAKLTSEVEKAKEREKDASMRAEEAKVDTEKAALEKELAEAENHTLALEEKLKLEEERHEKTKVLASRIESWDDFWAAVGSGDEGPPEADASS